MLELLVCGSDWRSKDGCWWIDADAFPQVLSVEVHLELSQPIMVVRQGFQRRDAEQSVDT